VKQRFPKAILQWEDFKKVTAFTLLDRYRKVLTSFNDDIQGTSAVAVAGMIAGSRATGIPLKEQRIVILGAGAAGVGIARVLRDALKTAGLEGEALISAIANLDSHGFLVDDKPISDIHKRPFAWPAALAEKHGLGKGKPRDLLAVVRALKPTMLIGTSGEPGVFTEDVIREMARHTKRPLIFPMSNPTSKSEAVPADILNWTDGHALIATGSPFPPVTHLGKTHVIGQGNNAFIFPGVGLGLMVSEAREVTEGMFVAAARRLAEEVHQKDMDAGSLFPSTSQIRYVTAKVAESVAQAARDQGLANRVLTDAEIPKAVAAAMWNPVYLPIEAASTEPAGVAPSLATHS
jgi:malic enzyme